MPSVAAVSTVTVGLLTVIPFIALMIWIAQRQKEGTEVVSMFDTFAGEIIGGHLTQGQAKAIDVITGAVLAPLLVAGFNFVFFNNARVSTVNENQNKVVPLRALVAASSTNSGSYNITRSVALVYLKMEHITHILVVSFRFRVQCFHSFSRQCERAPTAVGCLDDCLLRPRNYSIGLG